MLLMVILCLVFALEHCTLIVLLELPGDVAQIPDQNVTEVSDGLVELGAG